MAVFVRTNYDWLKRYAMVMYSFNSRMKMTWRDSCFYIIYFDYQNILLKCALHIRKIFAMWKIWPIFMAFYLADIRDKFRVSFILVNLE